MIKANRPFSLDMFCLLRKVEDLTTVGQSANHRYSLSLDLKTAP